MTSDTLDRMHAVIVNETERAWRDAHAGSVHVANDIDRALASYGQLAVGLPVTDVLV